MRAKRNKVFRTCELCEKVFVARRDGGQRGPNRFCSSHCNDVYLRRQRPARLWDRLDYTAGCWRWTGAVDGQGYGQVLHYNQMIKAHRLAWILTHGDIPDDLWVLHRCHSPACCNPKHLYLGPSDSRLAQTAAAPYLRGEQHGRARLTEAQVREIRVRYLSGGITQTTLAAEYGVAQATIHRIVTWEIWEHI